MNVRFFFLSLLLCCCLVACEEAPTNQQSGVSSPPVSPPVEQASPPPAAARGIKNSMDCSIPGKQMEDNELWVKEEGIFVGILADSTTYNDELGDSYRILTVIATDSCQTLYREALPVNFSPDFPYYLSIDLYEPNHQLVCAQGFDFTYCVDVKNRRVMPQMTPEYLSERISEDAQSGMPQGLLLRGDYLFGMVEDYGVFAFDISNKEAPKAHLPAAEFLSEDENYYPLFFLPEAGKYQAVVMTVDEEEMRPELKPLFDAPRAIIPQINKNVRNNRFLVLQEKVGTETKRAAIDMKNLEAVALPENLVNQPVASILDWLKKNR
ncbi:MAG: hypothetical protein AAGG75_10535 [Bacteroidota bacterium]